MKYIVYQTTNLVNNKIYIGVHKTINPDIFDGYYGCGLSKSNNYWFLKNPYTPFHLAVAKYGLKNFKRTIISIFDTAEEAYALEAQIVNRDFIKRNDTYNVSIGGNGGNFYFPINQFDLNGDFICTWDNCSEAAYTLGVSATSVQNAVKYKSSCLHYFWSKEQSINIKEFTKKVYKKTYKYDLNGDLIAIFETLADAAKEINESEKKVSRAILNNYQCGGFYYSYTLLEKYIPKKFSMKEQTIYIYDLKGNFITSLHSGKPIQEFFNITSYSCLKQAILQNRPYKNYQIFLEKLDNVSPVSNNKNISKKVGRYSLNGELLEIYKSIREAKRNYGSSVERVLRNQQSQTKGFIFKYLE